MIEIRQIQNVKFHQDFFPLSEKFGYTQDLIFEYLNEIEELVALWTSNKQVEIYSEDSDRKWGRIKDSSGKNRKNPLPGAIPYYIDLFHARVDKAENDPLLLITFENDDLIIRMFTDHNDLFGSKDLKQNYDALRKLKKRISDLIFNR